MVVGRQSAGNPHDPEPSQVDRHILLEFILELDTLENDVGVQKHGEHYLTNGNVHRRKSCVGEPDTAGQRGKEQTDLAVQ